MKYAFLLFAGLAFASCGNNEATDEINEATEAVGDVGNDIADGARNMGDRVTDMDADMTSFNETNDAIRNSGGDVLGLEPGAAVGVIDGWIAKLDGMDGTGEITENLRDLKEELTDGDIDGQKVGTLLNALGEDTAEIAGGNAAANMLAKSLTAAGQKLGGM